MTTSRLPYYSQPGDQESDLNIREFWSILRRRRATFIQIAMVTLAVGIVATLVSKPIYETQAKILVPAANSTVNLIDATNPIAALLSQSNPDSVPTQIQVLESPPFQNRAKELAKVTPQPGVVPVSVQVEAVKDTNVIQITVSGGNPKAISALAKAMVKLHDKESRDQRNQGLNDALTFVERQKNTAEIEQQNASNKLHNFLNSHPILQQGAEQNSRMQSYMELQDRALAMESDALSTRAQIQMVQRQIARTQPDLVENHLVENPQRGLIQGILFKLRMERQDLLQGYEEDSDPVKELDERIKSYQKQLDGEKLSLTQTTFAPNPLLPVLRGKETELQGSLIKSERALGAITAQLSAQAAQIRMLGPWKFDLDKLTEQHQRAQQRFNMLSDKFQDLQIRRFAVAEGNRPIQSARVPNRPVQPRPLLNAIVSLILAVILGAAGALLQDYLDDRVSDPEDVERLVGITSLGHVPHMLPDQPHLVSALPSNSHVSEAYRTIRSSLGFAALDSPIHRLQITSASQGEGKTLTSVNIATAMALDGKKVILVDADLRRPQVSKVLELPLAPGLSEVLVGIKPWREVIHSTDVPNLQVICAGSVPPNPAELLGTHAFEQLANELAAEADMVIFDTPPCMPVTDPMIVAARMDGVLLVISSEHTRRAALRYMVTMLGRTRARILGAVFNRVDTKKGGYYHQYYNHYYADGYLSVNGSGSNGHGSPSKQTPPAVASGAGDRHSTEVRKDDQS